MGGRGPGGRGSTRAGALVDLCFEPRMNTDEHRWMGVFFDPRKTRKIRNEDVFCGSGADWEGEVPSEPVCCWICFRTTEGFG